MNTLESDLAEARDEIARLKVQLDAKQNIIEFHRDFRAAVVAALDELREKLYQWTQIRNEQYSYDLDYQYQSGCRAAMMELDATIAALNLKPHKEE